MIRSWELKDELQLFKYFLITSLVYFVLYAAQCGSRVRLKHFASDF